MTVLKTDGDWLDNKDLELLLVCSFRYALGRRTYMPSVVQSLCQKYAHALLPCTLQQMADDVDKAPSLGDACDVEGWTQFAAWCRYTAEEKEKR